MTGSIARVSVAGCLALAFAGCATIAPVPDPGEEFLISHYILAHEDGFALSKEREPGRLTQRTLSVDGARRDVEANVFAAGIDAYLRRRWPNLDSVELLVNGRCLHERFDHVGMLGQILEVCNYAHKRQTRIDHCTG